MIPGRVDVLVVGAGPAGIATAVHAAEGGRRGAGLGPQIQARRGGVVRQVQHPHEALAEALLGLQPGDTGTGGRPRRRLQVGYEELRA